MVSFTAPSGKRAAELCTATSASISNQGRRLRGRGTGGGGALSPDSLLFVYVVERSLKPVHAHCVVKLFTHRGHEADGGRLAVCGLWSELDLQQQSLLCEIKTDAVTRQVDGFCVGSYLKYIFKSSHSVLPMKGKLRLYWGGAEDLSCEL